MSFPPPDWVVDRYVDFDDDSACPLQQAIAAVEFVGEGLVRWLLEAGDSPDGTSQCEGTPLMTAALYGQVSTILLLSEFGANFNAPEPLQIAEREGHEDAILTLCALGAPQEHWPQWVTMEDAKDYVEKWKATAAAVRLPACDDR